MRYALYYAPSADHPLHAFGSAWLGRDVISARAVARTPIAGFDAGGLDALTAEPRRYGLHATLKPPFRLADGCAERDLIARCERFAAAHRAAPIGELEVRRLDGFVALRPRDPAPEAARLAMDCVRDFDDLRAAPSPEERARREKRDLTPRQRELMARWGYPHVDDQFRFHLTLTGPLEPSTDAAIVAALAERYRAACVGPVAIDAISLFVEPADGAPFECRRRFALQGA